MRAMKQGFSWWCFANRGVEPKALLAGTAKIGYQAVDLIDEPLWPMARDHGLTIAAVNGHGTLSDGLNRRENAARIEGELLANIDKAAQWKIPVLICFSGNRNGLGDETGLAQCAETLARVAPRAAEAGVTLAMELLNSKIDHPGCQCDHTAWGVRLCERVGSPAVRLLYDIYHMQIMEGDVIRTIQQAHPYFAHYHTAGNPGRGPLDQKQELYYPAIFDAIEKTGYQGFVSHEFLPAAGTNPLKALAQAFELGQTGRL
jgi:hydroxypyruvate isomerase